MKTKFTPLLLLISTLFASLLGYGTFILFTSANGQTSIEPLPKNEGMSDPAHMMHDPSMIKNDQDFLNLMIPHHQEAVYTSNLLLKKNPDIDLSSFLKGVVTAQTKEIADMKTWYKQWYGTTWKDDGSYMSMMPNFTGMNLKAAQEAYLNGMIQHHQGAIDMAKAIQKISKRKEILTMAEAIIKTQGKEIDYMNELLKK